MSSTKTNKLKVLIIEDEPFAQIELKRLLGNIQKEIEVLDCIDSIEESIEWIKANSFPDLIFMDIQLSDGLSFEIFRHINVKAPVIFTTAFNEYAVQAFKVNSIGYLLKPIVQEDLEAAIDKLDDLKKQYAGFQFEMNLVKVQSLLESINPKAEYKSRIITKIGDQIKYIKTDEIAYFFAEDNIVFFLTENQGKYITDYSLNQLEVFLDPKHFFRLNRTYFVNIKSIIKVHKFFNSRLKVELKPAVNEDILISRVKVPEFLNWMES